MKTAKKSLGSIFIVIIISILSFSIAEAQIAAQCGSIFEGEFVQGNNNRQTYSIEMAPGEIITVATEVVGQEFDIIINVDDPTGSSVASADSRGGGGREETSTSILSTRGIYIIEVYGYRSGDLGIYTVYIGCTRQDGTIVEPGETQSTSPSNNLSSSQIGSNSTGITFSGIGFPGLPSVDFADVAELPLPVGLAMGGAITPLGGEIIGYTVDAAAGDVLDLSFTRISGNLNLGLVVLSADNQVVFQASLITSDTLTTRFTLPTAGTYTIGLFRIDLLPPDAPEATAFQITATLNP